MCKSVKNSRGGGEILATIEKVTCLADHAVQMPHYHSKLHPGVSTNEDIKVLMKIFVLPFTLTNRILCISAQQDALQFEADNFSLDLSLIHALDELGLGSESERRRRRNSFATMTLLFSAAPRPSVRLISLLCVSPSACPLARFVSPLVPLIPVRRPASR